MSTNQPQPNSPPRLTRLEQSIALITVVLGLTTTVLAAVSIHVSSSIADRQVQHDSYEKMLDRMGSGELPVRINAIRQVTQFVTNNDNYDDRDVQSADVRNVMVSVEAYIKERSPRPSPDLSKFEKPLPLDILWAGVYSISRLLNWEKDNVGPNQIHPSDLSNVDLHGAYMAPATQAGDKSYILAENSGYLYNIDLRQAKMVSARIIRANLGGAVLTGADLVGQSDLTGSSLNGARLDLACLNSVSLREADLTNTDFTNAWLLGVDLTGAKNLTPKAIEATHFDRATKWPNGFIPGVAPLPDKRDRQCPIMEDRG